MVKAIKLRCKSYHITNRDDGCEIPMSCIALYYRALLNSRIFADFRSKIEFRDFDGKISRVKYETNEWIWRHRQQSAAV